MLVFAAAVVVLIAALIAVNVLYIRLLDRKDARQDRQVQRLCQRIQAPELAVIEHDRPPTPDEPAVDTFDDSDYWKSKGMEVEA